MTLDFQFILSLVIAGLVLYSLLQLARFGLTVAKRRAKAVRQVAARLHAAAAPAPIKCYVRTFRYADGKEITFHSLCDGAELAKLTDAYARTLHDATHIETKDTVHWK